jgi:hypothetical protein
MSGVSAWQVQLHQLELCQDCSCEVSLLTLLTSHALIALDQGNSQGFLPLLPSQKAVVMQSCHFQTLLCVAGAHY